MNETNYAIDGRRCEPATCGCTESLGGVYCPCSVHRAQIARKKFYEEQSTGALFARYRGAWDANDPDVCRVVRETLAERGVDVSGLSYPKDER